MLEEQYGGYFLQARPEKKHNGRYSVKVLVSRKMKDDQIKMEFAAEDKIWYILKIEAENESINLGKNLIKKNLIGF